MFPVAFAPCFHLVQNYGTFCRQGAIQTEFPLRLQLHGAVSFRRSQRDASNGTVAALAPLVPGLADTVLPKPLVPAETQGPPKVQHSAPSRGLAGRRDLSDDTPGPWAWAKEFYLLQAEKFCPVM